MRWVPSSCCFSCYPLLPGCASCAWGVRPPPFHRHLLPSLLSLGSGASLYGSSSFLSKVFLRCPDFSSSSSSWLVSFGFPSVCTGFSFPLSFCSLCVHGSGAFIFPTTFFPCRIISGGLLSIASLLQVVVLLAGGHASPFLFIVAPSGVPCRSSVWFLIFLSSLLALMASSSSVSSFPSSAGFSHPLVARRLGVPPSRHPSIHLLVGGWSSSMALLLHGLLPLPLHLAIAGSFSLSLGLPPLLRCCGSLSYQLLRFWCRSSCLHALLLLGVSCSSFGLLGASFSAHCCLYAVLLPPSYFLSAILPPMVYIPVFRCLPSLGTVSSVPVRSYFFLFVWALGRLAWFPCPASPSLVSIPLSFLQVVSSCPSLGALLTRSNLRYTTRRGLPLGRVSYWLASWRFIVVPIPHGSPLLLVALLLVPPRSCAGVFLAFDFLLGSFPFTWAPTCCFLRLLRFPSVCPPLAPILALARVSHYFSVFPSWCLGRISVPSQQGPPSGPSLFCRGFRAFFPMVHFLSTSLSVFLVCSDSSFNFSVCTLLSASEVFLAVSLLLLVAGGLSRLRLFCFCSSF